MTAVPATITAEVMVHADGRPIAYIDATAVVVFAYQQPSGAYVIDIYTRDDTAAGRLRLLIDGELVPTAMAGQGERPQCALRIHATSASGRRAHRTAQREHRP
jgi:hypothetical protein